MAHDREAYEKAKAIMDKFWPTDMCGIKETFVRSHIEQQMALEFERLRNELASAKRRLADYTSM